ncbi:hypothetical protein bas52_0125 [Escherichia phage RudolfGeigy]|uniref:Uncharacterized protein n=2 Tax=Vequintavirus TaxID=1914852 RepID=A0AAE8AYN0_9CAUD|nr:hypothetical protein SOPHIAROSE_170 [Escherichia phage vB_EcoM_SophiaRose]QXV75674.1 hypothetical protein bas56_0123 [Escherichia phage AlexBoehm]QXV84204.1 hypothetical protein bas52_0125 [Escherichia phage RudolfGeigy]
MRKIIITMGIVAAMLAIFPFMVRYVLINVVLVVSDLVLYINSLF